MQYLNENLCYNRMLSQQPVEWPRGFFRGQCWTWSLSRETWICTKPRFSKVSLVTELSVYIDKKKFFYGPLIIGSPFIWVLELCLSGHACTACLVRTGFLTMTLTSKWFNWQYDNIIFYKDRARSKWKYL